MEEKAVDEMTTQEAYEAYRTMLSSMVASELARMNEEPSASDSLQVKKARAYWRRYQGLPSQDLKPEH